MAYRQAVLFAGVGIFSVAGAVGGTRWRSIELRRAELNNEYAKIMEDLRTFDEESLSFTEGLREKERKTKALHETVDTLWEDRLQRYHQTSLDINSYLVALPEAIGALKGLSNHYRYMSEEMRKFVVFDIACSKVHNLSLLLEHGRAVGIPRVVETVRQMFLAEPLLEVVCENVAASADISCPETLAQTSAAFSFCLNALNDATESVALRFGDQLKVETTSPSVLSDAVSRVVRALKVNPLSRGQREIRQSRMNLYEILTREMHSLYTEDDVRAALQYVQDMKKRFGDSKDSAAAVTASSSEGHEDFRTAVKADEQVKAAMAQMELWANAAATFLMRRQAQDALDCYQLLLSQSLTKVNKLNSS